MTCTLEEHRAHISRLVTPVFEALGTESLPVASADLSGRVTAQSHHALLPIPAFTNSQMDGFAVRSTELADASEENPVALPIGFTAAAGDAKIVLQPGTASPVMTGAVIPHGADAVIPVEHTIQGAFESLMRPGEGEPKGIVSFTGPVTPGTFIRPQGQDLAAGAEVAAAGTRLNDTRIGALAASGIATASVRRRPVILLCTTGNELGAGDLTEGQIPDANSPMLAARLRSLGAQVRTVQLPDDPQRFLNSMQSLAQSVDLILTVGGVSAGAYEVVREALSQHGGDFHHVAMQPGGPQGHAQIGSTPVVCFPGNPVSAWLSLEMFLAPALRRIAGLPDPAPEVFTLAEEAHSPAGKHQIRRALITGGGLTLMDPGSHLIHDLARADALVHLPVGVDYLPAGSSVEAWRLHV